MCTITEHVAVAQLFKPTSLHGAIPISAAELDAHAHKQFTILSTHLRSECRGHVNGQQEEEQKADNTLDLIGVDRHQQAAIGSVGGGEHTNNNDHWVRHGSDVAGEDGSDGGVLSQQGCRQEGQARVRIVEDVQCMPVLKQREAQRRDIFENFVKALRLFGTVFSVT